MFEAIRRREKLLPRIIPYGTAPVSVDRSARILAPHNQPDAAAHRMRSHAAGALADVGAPDQYLHVLLTPSEFAEYKAKVGTSDCKYSLARSVCWKSVDGGRGAQPADVITHGELSTDFDTDRYVTTVTITGYEFETNTSDVQRLVASANPENWQKSPGGFFLKSEPGTWSRGHWRPGSWGAGGGDLLEETQWQWNEETSGQIDNILRISDLKQTPASISYNYSLRECIKSNFGFVWERGGLDVDNGYYCLRSATGSSPGRSKVTISSKKAVRYTTPRGAPAEFSSFLNFMAPALITLLMQMLVYRITDPPTSESS